MQRTMVIPLILIPSAGRACMYFVLTIDEVKKYLPVFFVHEEQIDTSDLGLPRKCACDDTTVLTQFYRFMRMNLIKELTSYLRNNESMLFAEEVTAVRWKDKRSGRQLQI